MVINFPYSLYDQILNNSDGKENLYTYVEKVDARGSNCETSESLVRKYIKVNQNNSISLVICLLLLFTICPCCILAMFKKDDIIIEIQNKSVKTSGDALAVIDQVIAQGKENILVVFYAGPNSRKYIGVRLSLN